MPETIQISLDDADLSTIDRHIVEQGGTLSRADVIVGIIGRWARDNAPAPQEADEGLRPEQLNASNDS